jgi:hypothetical protein
MAEAKIILPTVTYEKPNMMSLRHKQELFRNTASLSSKEEIL